MSATDAPVVPYTGLDTDMQHDQRVLKGELSAPLRMPGKFDAVFDGEGRLHKPAADFNTDTLRNLDEFYKELDEAPPAAAVVVNFHPLTLRVNGGRHYYDGVPPCTPEKSLAAPGRQHSALLLYETAADPVPQDSGNHTFSKILPIWKAQSYMSVGNGNPELWGMGAFVFEASLEQIDRLSTEIEKQMRAARTWEGAVPADVLALALTTEMWDANPKIKTFDDTGTPKYQETGETVQVRRARGVMTGRKRVPVMAHYRDVYMDIFNRRNETYLAIYKRVNSDWKNTDPAKRKNVGINGMTRDQAQVLLNIGLILEGPEWLTKDAESSGVSAEKCSYCSANVKVDAVMCGDCGWPVDPYRAFMDSKITVEHLSLDDLPEDKLAEVYREDARRKSKKASAQELAQSAPVNASSTPATDPLAKARAAKAAKAAEAREKEKTATTENEPPK